MRLALLALLMSALSASASDQAASANPIRKVVSMLQGMQKKIAAEGQKEKELFDKFMCYCRTSGSDLGSSIEAAEKKVPEMQTDLKEGEGELAQLKLDLTEAKDAREAANNAMSEATALREKEAAAFAGEKAATETNVAAMGKAISALGNGMSGAFLQTNVAEQVRKIASDLPDMIDGDRDDILSFLSGRESYAPQSGQITGILKQMKDTLSSSLAEMIKEEENAAASYQELMTAKKKEAAALTTAIEEKSVRSGQVEVRNVELKADLTDTQEALAQDTKFQADLEKNCATKQQEWDAISKARSEEVLALADTIKILNDDDALELFKKTLPGAGSFLQTRSLAAVRLNALAVLREERSHASSHRPELDFLMMSLQGKTQDFDFIKKKIESMIVLLGKQQEDDDVKKAHCAKHLDELADEKKSLEHSVEKEEKAIDEAEDTLATLKSEIQALADGIKKLDQAVIDATEQRKEEHADSTTLIAQDSAAKELLEFAKNRLNKFYNPTQYRAPTNHEVLFVQISAHLDDDTAPSGYITKSDESSGVIAMIDSLIAELSKEMTEAKKSEEFAQADYEEEMKDSAAKRAADSKSLAEKEKAKAELETELQGTKEDKMAVFKRLMSTDKVITETHGECDWLLSNYETRKEARAEEVASLRKDIEVLSGANE